MTPIQVAFGLSRIESRGRGDPKAASGAIRVSDEANELMARIWSDPPSTHEFASARMRRLYHEERTLPAKEQPPLPDVVQAMSLLDDNDGVIHDENDGGTLRPANQANGDGSSGSEFSIPQRPPRRKRSLRRSSSLESPFSAPSLSLVAHRANGCANSALPRPATCFGLPPTPKMNGEKEVGGGHLLSASLRFDHHRDFRALD
ncbi:unnamed protein product [Toxocara canis]|uniref:Uncharacterized protein n=1 Tax=Toxocara canis TaxID=6265 RepID=A0A183U3C5_TOXCA|nr:unnamed protein product [Toxocara canis]